MEDETRISLKDARRLVVKIGSRSLLSPKDDAFSRLATQVAQQREAGRLVTVVSSGAVALGRKRLGFSRRPKNVAKLQAAAAAGQSGLIRAFEEAFQAHDLIIAQVLLNPSDLTDRDRYLNARAALDALLELGVVPIINENDTVSTEELQFGDNDQLAAMVATLVGADLLLMLTDVEGVLDEHGQRIRTVVDSNSNSIASAVRPPDANGFGLGGMTSKIASASRATRRGVPVVIGPAADKHVIHRVLAGEDVGTLLCPRGARLTSRKHWIAFTLQAKGFIVVDEGASRALRREGSSLLPAGVVGVRGDFDAGDAVTVVERDGREVARGLARYGVRDVARLAGASSSDIARRIGYHDGDAIIHRDDLAVGVDETAEPE